MSRRFLIASVVLAATVAFLVGLVVAGSLTPTAAVSAPTAPAPVVRSRTTASPMPPPASFADVVERVNPAVVSIDAASRGGAREGRRIAPPLGAPPGDRLDPTPRDRDGPRQGTGAGFIIDSGGAILTNHHVVDGADRITVRLADGRELRASTIGSDPDTDIALIQVETTAPLPVATLGDSDDLRVGEWVMAIGNPLTYEHTVTVGVVSFLGRKLFDSSLDRYIQTDAAINFGNSGGPLINARGEVIGINSAVSSRASNIGFAVPINQATGILAQLRESGRVSRGYIGVMLRDIDRDLQAALGLRSSEGALIQDVTPGSPGARAGLRTYDVIVSVDGEKIREHETLVRLIAERRPGSTTSVGILRDGRFLQVPLKLAERPQREPRTEISQVGPAGPRGSLLGLSVRELDERGAARLGVEPGENGLIVSNVEPMSPAFDADIRRGHLLLEINRRPVRSIEDFRSLTDSVQPGDILTMYLYRPERNQRTLETVKVEPR
jgi:serine protease Do